jgi:hypothetical protein
MLAVLGLDLSADMLAIAAETHTSSINCSVAAGLSGADFATNGSAPW